MAKLTVQNKLLYLGDSICREVGWNCSALLARRWYNQNDNEYIRIIDALAQNNIRVIRVVGMPTAPGTSARTSGNWDTWGIPAGVPSGNAYTNLSSTFYEKQREILDYCSTKGISVIITLMGRMATLADLKGETQSVGFGSSGSATRTFARTIFANYVNELKDHAAIAAWEINNEWNNYAELQALPGTATGSPTYTSPNDLVSMTMFTETMVELATTIKTNDSTRAVISGNAGGWNTNLYGLDGYANVLPRLNLDPIDTISYHQYSESGNNGYLESGFAPLEDLIEKTKEISNRIGKPLILGEVGVKETLTTKDKDWAYLQQLLNNPSAPQLILLWDFYPQGLTLPSSNTSFSCFPGDPRGYQVEATKKAQQSNISFRKTSKKSNLVKPSGWVNFTGSGQNFSRSLPIDFNGPFTISFWARFTSARDSTNFSRIISTTSNEATDGSGNGFIILQNPTARNEPYFRLYNAVGGQSATLKQGLIKFNKWNHFTYRFTPSTQTLESFFNGFQASSNYTSFTGSWVDPLGQFVIGTNYNSAATSFKGQLAQVTVTDRAITDEEIFFLTTGITPKDSFKWLFTKIDSDLTIVGSPEWQSFTRTQR